MDIIMLVMVIIGGIPIFIVGRQVCLLVAWHGLGVKPKLLREKQLDRTVDEYVVRFVQTQAAAAEQAGNPFSTGDKERIDSVMKDFTRKAILAYVEDCQLSTF
jgi:hypothetical protein